MSAIQALYQLSYSPDSSVAASIVPERRSSREGFCYIIPAEKTTDIQSLTTPVAGVIAGFALLALDRAAARLSDPARGLLKLSLGEVSFTEVFGMFLIGYSLGAFVTGANQNAGPPGRPQGGAPGGAPGRFGGGRFSPLSRDGLPFIAGLVFAVITILYRVDLFARLSNTVSPTPGLSAIVGIEAQAVEHIPAGGHGQITFRDPIGNLVSVIATADVDIAPGTRVRIVGARELNPLVTPLA